MSVIVSRVPRIISPGGGYAFESAGPLSLQPTTGRVVAGAFDLTGEDISPIDTNTFDPLWEQDGNGDWMPK